MTRMTSTEAKERISDVISRAEYRGEWTILQRRGKDVAAVVSIDDLRLLERLRAQEEDRLDNAEVNRVLSDPSTEFVPWEQVRDRGE